MLQQRILARSAGIVTYGMTPPKRTHSSEKIAEIAAKQVQRLHGLDIDGLILYDVQDEQDRTGEERPFPFLPTLDPAQYSASYLQDLSMPRIIYRCVGNYSEAEFTDMLQRGEAGEAVVYVGASSRHQQVRLRLPEAYALSRRVNDGLPFGGVVIPERHLARRDEHERVADKIRSGCAFFVSQATFNVEATKDFLSDYYYYCREHELEMVPILINLAPCGSPKTIAFMKWLGISIPKWLENDLVHSHDILDKSIALSQQLFEELLDFGLEKGIPLGCSIESVSTRKVEIEASVELVSRVKRILDNRLGLGKR
ncbi:methylenetetrahydrofolate reductase [Paenibacillus sp. IB182496]|uniref:Methylenetetrahydrofolate reductase n=1 Tax=Paenibacillus sabuli TaxID=2772509 RepID=A0A927BZ48_9BACL|nr:methylenetetrahydrofolate reductase [Paenibacillus sabuli]MBD2848064.1 methylenetetrahydrofolate reductase [Paenibacillus sabuli]